MHNSLSLRTIAVAALAFGASSARAATTITFAGGTTNAAIGASYGSKIDNTGTVSNGVSGFTGATVSGGQGTPNIALSWSPQNATTNSQRFEFYTDSVWTGGVAQLNAASIGNAYTIGFTPDAGYGVAIQSVDFNSYYALADTTSNGGQFSFSWSVQRASDSAVMASGSTGVFTRTNNPTVAINFTATDSAAYNLIITRLANGADTNSNNANIAIDNVVFSQFAAVPEPSTCGLLAAGSLAFAAFRRRRRA